MRRVLDTPCPTSSDHDRSFTTSFYGEETANVEYTTAFHASFRNVRPKRRQATYRANNFIIHEDAQPKQAPKTFVTTRLAQPAKRKVLPFPTVHEDEIFPKVGAAQPSGEAAVNVEDAVVQTKPAVGTRRRDNLYIPSEDTTQPTMWMGIFSPIKYQDKEGVPVSSPATVELTGIGARMAEKQRKLTPSARVAGSVKRTPLRINVTAQSQATPQLDRPGKPTGKENLPPGHLQPQIGTEDGKCEFISLTTRDVSKTRGRLHPRQNASGGEAHHAFNVFTAPRSSYILPPARASLRTASQPRLKPCSRLDTSNLRTSFTKDDADRDDAIHPVIPKVPTRFIKPIAASTPSYPQVPLLENIARPEMYEDDWISHQESAMSQLINSIFKSADDQADQSKSQNELRASLLALYADSDMTLVHSRLQAATSFGALSLSRAAAIHLEGLSCDVGRRKAFLDFWLNTYNHELLQIALEVIVGRQVCLTSSQGFDNIKWTPSSRRMALRLFMEAFLIRNEDVAPAMHPKETDHSIPARTLLRSLMIVKVLDMLKSQLPTDSRLLFRRTSRVKSSMESLQSVFNMLNPAAGDQLRALRSIGYTVSYEQNIREEISYKIKNIAVDLRDGVLLTRLTEILLYTLPSLTLAYGLRDNESTLMMPEGESILIDRMCSSPLVQHLRLPATSRAVKLWNIQIAFGALNRVDSINNLLHDIQAEHVVDGHREMTMKLLWLLVSRLGLPSLVDWSDMEQEIARLGPVKCASRTPKVGQPSQQKCEEMLQSWARSVAFAHQIPVINFNSSSTAGECFEAIIDEYEPHLPTLRNQESTSTCERLSAVGCSKHFASLFAPASPHVRILGQDFMVIALTFLASRLLGVTKTARNAVKIQRCWRQHWERVVARRMEQKRSIAQACAVAVALKMETSTRGTEHTTIDHDASTENEGDIWLSLE